MKTLFLSILLVFVGCGNTYSPSTVSVPGVSNPSAPLTPVLPTPLPTVLPSPTPIQISNVITSTVNLTVFSLTKTTFVDGVHFYTTIGYCANYLTKTYCWDDGLKTVFSNGNLIGQGTYWGQDFHNGVFADQMNSPTYITGSLLFNLPNGSNGYQDVTNMLATGNQAVYACTSDISGNLNCGTFNLQVM